MRIQVWGVRGSLPSPLTPSAIERRIEKAIELFVTRGQVTLPDIKPFLATLSPDFYGSPTVGIDLALHERIRRILFMHHDASAHDEALTAIELETKRYYENQKKQFARNRESFKEFDWEFAREGMVVEI